jgi:ATP-dependent Clp protease adaptor protein ClpS
MSPKPIFEDDDEFGAGLAEAPVRPELNKPPMFKVLLLNDDFTPTDYVVTILVRFFGLNEDAAIQIMWAIHRQGKGVCGVFTREVAETKVQLVRQDARAHGHPLLAVMEEA